MSEKGLVVRSHWHLRCAQIAVPVSDFYNLIKAKLEEKKVPNLKVSPYNWHEGGLTFSPKREYLRIRMGKFIFDVCTAPYADGSFFSCWSAIKRPSPIWGVLMLFGFIFVSIFSLVFLVAKNGDGVFLFWLIGFLVVLFGAINNMSNPSSSFGEYFFVIPFIGPFLEATLSPSTYYKIDTHIMAEQAIYEAVQEAVSESTSAKGYRALTSDELKPVYKQLVY